MLKKTKIAIGLLFAVSLVKAEVNFDNGKAYDISEEIKNVENISVPELSDKSFLNKNQKEWTIMVFLNAKNDLERFGIKDMNEMEMVGSSDQVNIVVEMGRIKGYDSSNGDWTGVKRFLIKKDTDTNIINSPVIQEMGERDMGDYKNLADFVKWAKKTYPAKKYMLIVWNHGSGWEKSKGGKATKGISYDEASGNHINTPQLGLALKEAGKVDVYGSDACLMAMAEVIYEIKDSATYIVGSEETEPGDGYTYNTLLAPLIAKPTMGPAELAKLTVDAYSDHYKEIGEGSTQAYVRAEKIDEFLKLVNEFAYAMSQSGEKQVVKDAMNQAQSYAISDNKDLYHFAQLVVSKTQNADVKGKGQALMNFIKDKLVAHNRTNNSEGGWWGPTIYDNSHGVAIYMPSNYIGAGYDELAWAKYSNWDEFIKWYQSDKTDKKQGEIVYLKDLFNGVSKKDKNDFMLSTRMYNGMVASQSYLPLKRSGIANSNIDKILSVFEPSTEETGRKVLEVSEVFDFSDIFSDIPEDALSDFFDSFKVVNGRIASFNYSVLKKYFTPDKIERVEKILMPKLSNEKERRKDEWCEIWVVNDSKSVYRGCSYQEGYVCNSSVCK